MIVKQWLLRTFLGNRRQAERRAADGYAASHWSGRDSGPDSGNDLKHDPIRDISATGLYLLTQERWRPGTTMTLLLHRDGVASDAPSEIVKMTAHSVRCGRDGVALAFDLPSGVDPLLWVKLVEKARYDAGSDDIVGPFKVAKALAFLSRICAPHAGPQASAVRQKIRSSMTGQRFWNAIEIALQAESLLSARPASETCTTSADVVVKILEEGSWTEESAISRVWAGLLAGACSPNGADAASYSFVEILRQLTPMDLRLFNEASLRAAKYRTEDGLFACRRLSCNTEDILRFSGFRDLLRMGRSLERLSEFGLIEERFKTSMFVPVDGINITPTHLGLKFFARCQGHPGEPEAYFEATPGTVVPWPKDSPNDSSIGVA